ncbi:hypothetical protein C8Q69DRAFT_43450 [Paecilomyces variotii]|uniref:Uncharacterized protein n=1 Tax=Byssochlamys spectabilis TaxID=264951 RepID=A0A443I7L2_BYSSP|nr:hypothetical protein C8Q69DRAFT_43450 [Paecilomyces variotii]RWQ99975.1 hypothetical protein C8Q69DRAFT_43450 [Paecilomyces variotii]
MAIGVVWKFSMYWHIERNLQCIYDMSEPLPSLLPFFQSSRRGCVYIIYSQLKDILRPRYGRTIMAKVTSDSTLTVCFSLRTRPVWPVLHPVLMSTSGIRLQEAHLETHDFSFSIPSTQGNRSLRILLLTPSSLSPSDKAETIYRIERLSSPPGGQDVLIAFLLSENAFTSASRRSNLAPLLDLQALLVSELPSPHSIPIVPIADSSTFLSSMQEYISALTNPPRLSVPREPVTSLLAHMTTSAPYHLLSAEESNILTDLFPSWRELSRAVRSDEGRELLREYLELETVRRIVEFWEGKT